MKLNEKVDRVVAINLYRFIAELVARHHGLSRHPNYRLHTQKTNYGRSNLSRSNERGIKPKGNANTYLQYPRSAPCMNKDSCSLIDQVQPTTREHKERTSVKVSFALHLCGKSLTIASPRIIEHQKSTLFKTVRPLTHLDRCTSTIGICSIIAMNP